MNTFSVTILLENSLSLITGESSSPVTLVPIDQSGIYDGAKTMSGFQERDKSKAYITNKSGWLAAKTIGFLEILVYPGDFFFIYMQSSIKTAALVSIHSSFLSL